MKYQLKLPELLSPAGSIDHLKAAINAGADAVYMGGDKFSARAYAQNFSGDRIREALHYAHFYDRRIYLTVNTLMKEKEVEEELYDFLLPYEEAGLDGVIVQDLGTASFIRSAFPAMELHGSTQMTITDVYGARAAARMGMTRIVPARELSLEELEEIRRQTGLELEVFVHGALCYCYSGQCLFSSLYGGRSGNRGKCAQPCRLPYQLIRPDLGDNSQAGKSRKKQTGGQDKNQDRYRDKGAWDQNGKNRKKQTGGRREPGKRDREESYLLSPRDLSALTVLPDLCRLPVDSLKIEGRMKNVEYVAGVTAIYRKYLDRLEQHFQATGRLPEIWQPDPADLGDLQDLYSRADDFTEGYFHRHNGREMMSMKSPKNTGRLLGHVEGRRKNRLIISFETRPEPQDILVIPLAAKGQEELVLTVPAELKLTRQGKYFLGELNAPAGPGISPGAKVYRRRKDALTKSLQAAYAGPGPRLAVDARIRLRKGEPASLTLSRSGSRVTVLGDLVQEAAVRPLSPDQVAGQVKKTGNTSFHVDQLDLDMDQDIFLPVSAIKQLRREACDRLQIMLERKKDRPLQEGKSRERDGLEKKNDQIYNSFIESGQESGQGPALYCTVYSEQMAVLCAGDDLVRGICLPADFFDSDQLCRLAGLCKDQGKEVCLILPRIARSNEDLTLSLLQVAGWDGIYINGIGQAQLIHEKRSTSKDAGQANPAGTEPMSAGQANPVGTDQKATGQASPSGQDSREPAWITTAAFYQWNRRSARQIRALYPWLNTAEYPVELTRTGISRPGLLDAYGQRELMVFGRLPLMVSVQCLKKSRGLCDHRRELLYLEDQKGRRLPVTTHCRDCINQIWQDKPRDLIGTDLLLDREKPVRLRMDLLDVSRDEFESVKARYIRWASDGFRKASRR